MARKLSSHFYIALAGVAALAVAAGILIYRATRPLESTAYIPGKVIFQEHHRLLQDYVRINTSNPPGNETAGARFLQSFLARHHVAAELIESAPGRGNLYSRIRGRQRGNGLLLLNHIDVVPADASGWSEPPFAGNVKMNMMYGRGTLDMKSIAICEILAFAALAESGKQPEHDVVFLATADEEGGGEFGVQWLLKNRPDIFNDVRYAINEGGITETLGDQITFFSVEVGSKEFVSVTLSGPTRESIRAARIALEPDIEPAEAERILPEVRDYFRAVAPHRVQTGDLLVDIDAAVSRGAFWRLPPSFRTLTQNDLSPAAIVARGGRFELDVEMSNLPDEDPDRRVSLLRERVAPYGVEVKVGARDLPAPIVSWKTPFFQALTTTVRKYYGKVDTGPVLLPYSTNDSRFLRPRGIAAYGIWPFPVNLYQTMGIHREDERVRLDWFSTGVAMTRDLVFRWAFAV